MGNVIRVIALILWIIGLILLVLALVPSIGGGGADKVVLAGVLFLGAIAGVNVAGVAG